MIADEELVPESGVYAISEFIIRYRPSSALDALDFDDEIVQDSDE